MRCLARIESAFGDDAIGRSAALNSSVGEAASLGERFPELQFFEGLARMRRGFAYRDEGEFDKAGVDFERAGYVFSREADQAGDRKAEILAIAGDAYLNLGEALQLAGDRSEEAFAKAVSHLEHAVSLDPGFVPQLERARRASGD